MENKCNEIKIEKISNLKNHPKNNNIHSVEQIKRLAHIIETQGFRNPIIVSNQSGYIVAGHARLQALKMIKAEYAPVIYQDFINDEYEYAFLTADNAIQEWSIFDKDKFKKELDCLQLKDFSIFGLKKFDFFDEKKEKNIFDKDEFIVIVELDSEDEQQDFFEDLKERGIKCKLMS